MPEAPLTQKPKDPRRVAAGKAAMRVRWGPPRIARLDELTPPQRALVLSLIQTMVRKPDDHDAA